MNSKSSTQHKCATTRSSKNIKDEAEVLILPPYLLEKLGIQLGSFQTTQECPTLNNKTDLSAVRTKPNKREKNKGTNNDSSIVRSPSKDKETSILETASLMKESVFLSPTFVPTVGNAIAGEVEIANSLQQSGKTAISITDELDIEHNLVNSFDIQQIMNSNNENGVIEFAENILQSTENSEQKPQAQETHIDTYDDVHLKTRCPGLVTTTEDKLNVLTELPSATIDRNNCTNKIEIGPEFQFSHGLSLSPSLGCDTTNATKVAVNTKTYPCMDNQLPEDQTVTENIDDCDKITLGDLEIKESLSGNLLNKIKSLEVDFLESVNSKHDTEICKTNMNQSSITIIETKNTPTSKVQILSQEIVNFKDCRIASPLNTNSLIPVTIDTIISTRKEKRSMILNANRIGNECKPAVQNGVNSNVAPGHWDESNENSFDLERALNSFVIKNHETSSAELKSENISSNMDFTYDPECMDVNYKRQSKTDSKGVIKSNNIEVINSKYNNKTLSLPSVNNNTVNAIINQCEPETTITLDIPYIDGDDNANEKNTNQSEVKTFEAIMPVTNFSLKDCSSLKRVRQSGANSYDTSISDMTNKLDEELKRKNKHLPLFVNAKRNKEKPNQSINGPSKLKSCIQGVEKPGGDDIDDPTELSINKLGLKTYQRVKKNNLQVFNFSEACSTSNVVVNSNVNDQLIDSDERSAISSFDSLEEYCLCNDFGQLTNYDDGQVYEHIHFWQTETVRCDPEIIFGIYDEEPVEIDHQSQRNILDAKEVTAEEITPICWNAIFDERSDHGNESPVHSSTVEAASFDSKKENQIFNSKQKRNSFSETKCNADIVENCTNIGENRKSSAINDNDEQIVIITDTSFSNTEIGVNDLRVETKNTPCLQSFSSTSANAESRFPEKKIEEQETTQTNVSVMMAEVKQSSPLKSLDDEIDMIFIDFHNNKIVQPPLCHSKEKTNQHLQVLHTPEDDAFIHQTNTVNSPLAKTKLKNTSENKSDSNMTTKILINIESDSVVQSEAEVEAQELPLASEDRSHNRKGVTVTGKKRRSTFDVSAAPKSEISEPPMKKTVKCGVCTQIVFEAEWTKHATQKHNCIAWKFGQTIDFEDEKLLEELNKLVKTNGVLECCICRFKINHIATFILHVEKCVNLKIQRDAENLKTVKCAVCQIEVPLISWAEHSIEHNYLTWKEGEAELDLNDQNMVRKHLLAQCVQFGGMHCKCGAGFTKALDFLSHLRVCKEQVSKEEPIKCGVCMHILNPMFWNEHLKEHNYLAWKDGEPALKMEDEYDLTRHLNLISKQLGGLSCKLCGKTNKRSKVHLDHIKKCNLESPSVDPGSAHNSIRTPDVSLDSSLVAMNQLDSPANSKSLDISGISDKPQTSKDVVDAHLAGSLVCGVCKNNIDSSNWISHIGAEHNYLARKEGENPIDVEDEVQVLQHLKEIISECKVLVCNKCGLSRKYPKIYLNHIKQCDGNTQSFNTSNNSTFEFNTTVECSRLGSDESRLESSDYIRTGRPGRPRKRPLISSDFDEEDNLVLSKRRSIVPILVRCGVCHMDVEENTWYTHIGKEHNYLAWKEGETPLNLDDEKQIWCHLLTISQILDKLVCYKCNYTRKKPKLYLEHVKNCSEPVKDLPENTGQSVKEDRTVNENVASGLRSSDYDEDDNMVLSKRRSTVNKDTFFRCAVCQIEVQEDMWYTHIGKEHNYLAWKEGETPLNLEDEKEVWSHLLSISQIQNKLVCYKCNYTRKKPKVFMEHIKNCSGSSPNCKADDSVVLGDRRHRESSEYTRTGRPGRPRKLPRISFEYDEDDNVDRDDKSQCESSEYYYVKTGRPGRPRKCLRISSDCKEDDNVVMSDDTSLERSKCIRTGRPGRPRKLPQIGQENTESASQGVRENVPANKNVESERKSSDFDEDDNVVLSKRRSTIPKHTIVRCGVCQTDVQEDAWYTHIGKEHNYMAWKAGETPLDLEDERQVCSHLLTISQILNKLVCYNCNYARKKPKMFLEHIKSCSGKGLEKSGNPDQSISIPGTEYKNSSGQTLTLTEVKIEYDRETPTTSVTCAVCKLSMEKSSWFRHIKQEHHYLAWQEGTPALDLDDEVAVLEYLKKISLKRKGLVCSRCEVVMKYPKPFLKHIHYCTPTQINPVAGGLNVDESEELIKCGVCSKDIETRGWIKHIQIAHNYLAWKEGETPIDLDNEGSVKEHLMKVIRQARNLICAKCGFTRRIAGYYMAHMETCDGAPLELFEDKESLLSKNKGLYECAMCHKKVLPKDWQKHAFDEHYNVTWIVGDVPIDLKSPYGADNYLKEYKVHRKRLVCNTCGESRVSLQGFYTHIITCGKTEEEMEIYKEDCTLCGKRYLGVYRSHHMGTHREEELAKLRLSQMYEKEPEPKESTPKVSGRRKAAVKANSVIENYQKTDSKSEFAYKCDNCSFGTDRIKQFQRHKCDTDAEAESEESEEDDLSEIDEGISEAEEEEEEEEELEELGEVVEGERKRKEAPKPNWLPFKLVKWKAYYEQLLDDFRNENLTGSRLFPEWLSSQYSFVLEDHVNNYMPKLTQSCKVLINGIWKDYEKFEGKNINRLHTMFAGGSIHRVRWVPSELHNDPEHNYLAVSAHLDGDPPRHNYDELPAHPGLIQIWDAGMFNQDVPKLVLGLAHDFGAVWDMDWCPSGVIEPFEYNEHKKEWTRLGLLAVACSNGAAYILSVPYPDSIGARSDNLLVKLKPVAELRHCSMESDRKRYQATAISWSKKKDHTDVVVAYSDGSIARYDLTNSSLLLKTTEDDLVVYYPYHDERVHNSSITGLDSFPGAGAATEAVCGAAPTGTALLGGAPYAGRAASHMPSADALFTPAWPAAIVTADEGLVHHTPNELDWHGCGRKLGVICSVAGCARCGRVMSNTPPLLRIARHFPPCQEMTRPAVASVNVVLLSLKRKKQTDKMEPITYDDCIKKYGVEFNILHKFKPSGGNMKDPFPERFPLADVTSMSFCTSKRHHDKVAVATHSGHVFIFRPA